MKMMKKAILFLTLFIIAAAAAGCTSVSEAPAPPVQAIPEAADSGSAEQAETVPADSVFSPEQLRDGILIPAVSFHPGIAGSTLKSAKAAAEMLNFCTENQLRLADQKELDQAMKDARELLSEDEKGWLQENLPTLLDLSDTVFNDYESVKGLFEDAGAGGLIVAVLADEHAGEDWIKAKAALAGL